MERSRRSRNRRGRRTNVQSAQRVRRMITRQEQGVAVRPSQDPPSWTNAPWWPLTIIYVALKTTTVDAVFLHAGVLAALGFTGDTKKGVRFNMRIQSVRAWGLAKQPLTLDVYEHFGVGGHKVKQLSDFGDAIHYSRVGWRYGATRNINVLGPNDKETLFAIDGDLSDKKTALIYIQLLVQVAGVPAASMALARMLSARPAPGSTCAETDVDAINDAFEHMSQDGDLHQQ